MSGPRPEVLLMGPVCVGKTTVGRLVAERLGVRFLDVDDHAQSYVLESDELDPAEWERLDAISYLQSYRYSEAAVVGTLERFLDEQLDGSPAVVALGAGHSSVLRDDLAPRIAAAVAPFRHRILLIPSLDADAAAATLRARCVEHRGGGTGGWVFDGVDLIRHWAGDPHQRALATDVVVTDDLAAEEAADRVISCL